MDGEYIAGEHKAESRVLAKRQAAIRLQVINTVIENVVGGNANQVRIKDGSGGNKTAIGGIADAADLREMYDDTTADLCRVLQVKRLLRPIGISVSAI